MFLLFWVFSFLYKEKSQARTWLTSLLILSLFIKALHRPAHDAQIAILLLIFRAVEDLGQWHSSELQVFGNGSIELVLQQLMKKETVDLKKKQRRWMREF